MYATDEIYFISDYVYVSHNPYKLGINAFMRFNESRYEGLEEHFTERKNGKASFDSLGRIFFIVLKMREADAVFRDVFVEEIDIPNIEKFRDTREDEKGVKITTAPKFDIPVVDMTASPNNLNKFTGWDKKEE